MELNMDVMNKPLVSICCLAYNHEKFIRQCLDGFLIQKCNFNFEVLIHDDASTDKTASIIKEYEKKYPKIIKPIYQTENQYSKNIGVSKTYQYPRAQGKYIALCEGDDYWTDPLKLQKQVDFLEANPDYVFSNSDVDVFNENTNRLTTQENVRIGALNRTGDVTGMDIITNDYYVRTLSIVARRDLVMDYSSSPYMDKYYSKLMMGDRPLWIYLAHQGKFHYLSESTATYRIHNDSATHQTNLKKSLRFKLSLREMKMVFFAIYPEDFTPSFVNKVTKSYYSCLLRYICFDPSYQVFVDEDSKSLQKIEFVRRNKWIRVFLRSIYQLKFKLKNIRKK